MKYLKPINKFLNEEALPLNLAKEYISYGKNRPSWLVDKLNELFDNQQRIYIPVDTTTQSKPFNRLEKEIERFLNYKHYEIKDYKLGIAFQRDNPKREVRIGKLLQKFGDTTLLKLFNEDPLRTLAKQQEEYSIVICQHPYDIAGMSCGRDWANSCLNILGGANRHYVPYEIQCGTFTVYYIKSSDKNINNPIGRVNVKLYSENDNSEEEEGIEYYNKFPSHWVWIPDTRFYGTFPKEGLVTLYNWLLKSQDYNDGYTYYKINDTYCYSGTAYSVQIDFDSEPFSIVEDEPQRVENWTIDRILEENRLDLHYDFMNSIVGSQSVVGYYFNDCEFYVDGGQPIIQNVRFEVEYDKDYLSVNLNELEWLYETRNSNLFSDVILDNGWGIDKLNIYAERPITYHSVIPDFLKWLSSNGVSIKQISFQDIYTKETPFKPLNTFYKGDYIDDNELMKFVDVQTDIFYYIINTFTNKSKSLNLIDISNIVLTTTYSSELYDLYPKMEWIENIQKYNIIKSKDDIVEDEVNLLIDKDIDFDINSLDSKNLVYEYFSSDGTKGETYAEISNDFTIEDGKCIFSELKLNLNESIFKGINNIPNKTFIYGDGEISSIGFRGEEQQRPFIFDKLVINIKGDFLEKYVDKVFSVKNLPTHKLINVEINGYGRSPEKVKLEVCIKDKTNLSIFGINLGNLDIFTCGGGFNSRRNNIVELKCEGCRLTTLKGVPRYIRSLDISNNDLEGLDGYIDWETLKTLNLNYNQFKNIEYFDELSSWLIAQPDINLSDALVSHNGKISVRGSSKTYDVLEIEDYVKTLMLD